MVVEEVRQLHYAITGGSSHRLDSQAIRRVRLQAAVRRWAEAGVDLIQIREKELDPGDLHHLVCAAMATLHAFGRDHRRQRPRLLVNTRADLAAAARADGVHLTSRPGELTPTQVRSVFTAARLPACLVSVSCHDLAGVANARQAGADFILFGPVFEKRIDDEFITEGAGLDQLRQACAVAAPVPVLALGGVTNANAAACLQAGARGVAGIRLFTPAVDEEEIHAVQTQAQQA